MSFKTFKQTSDQRTMHKLNINYFMYYIHKGIKNQGLTQNMASKNNTTA